MTPTYSIVVPVYNEEGNILRLHEKIAAVLDRLLHPSEIILVNDGSRDKSAKELAEVAAKDPRVKLIRFSKNFGQTAAMSAGFAHASGEIVIPMDADLQNDPADIPKLLQKLDEGYDVVSGWRKDRKDKSVSRKLPSFVANRMIAFITGVTIHDYGCTLKAYRKSILDGVNLYGEMHRFIPAYAAWNGARVTEIPVAHHPRTVGKSKYTISRTLRVVLDLLVVKFLTTYMSRPIHFFGVLGLFSILFGFLSGVLALVLKVLYAVPFIVTPLPLLTVFLIFLGTQFVLMGLLAEIQMRTYYESQRKTTYVIAEKVNF